MRKKTPLLASMACALAVGGAASSYATTLEKMSVRDLAQSAELIVVGTPTSAEYARQAGQIVTLTTFEVSGDALGGAPATVTVVTPGGRISQGKIQGSEIVAGAPAFAGGRQVMLFLNADENAGYSVTGFNQGLFSVDNGAVKLPQEVGGLMSVDDAFSLVRNARASSSEIVE